jgi:hypothetical protein
MGLEAQAKYVIWKYRRVPNACRLQKLHSVADIWELREGVPRGAGFPADAHWSMDPDFPYNMLLIDNLLNSSMLIVGSARLKSLLEEQRVAGVEYLPVTVLNHKGRPAGKEYFIINPIDPPDCLAREQCGITWSELDPDTIDTVEHLVIDPSKVEPERQLFRPKYFYDVILVERSLAEAIDRAGLQGIRWLELADYPER